MLGYMVLFMSFTVLMGQHPLPELVLNINYWIIIDPPRIILKCLAKKLLEAAFFFSARLLCLFHRNQATNDVHSLKNLLILVKSVCVSSKICVVATPKLVFVSPPKFAC